MFELNGKTAFITGASGGIGESIARMLHAQGAKVGLHGTRVEKLEALAKDLGEGRFANNSVGLNGKLFKFTENVRDVVLFKQAKFEVCLESPSVSK